MNKRLQTFEIDLFYSKQIDSLEGAQPVRGIPDSWSSTCPSSRVAKRSGFFAFKMVSRSQLLYHRRFCPGVLNGTWLANGQLESFVGVRAKTGLAACLQP